MQLLFKWELWELLKLEREIERSGMQIIIQMINVLICKPKRERGRGGVLIRSVKQSVLLVADVAGVC